MSLDAKKAYKSDEFFYVDKDGNRQDASLHEEILAGISPEGEHAILMDTYNRMVARGVDPAQARKALGLR